MNQLVSWLTGGTLQSDGFAAQAAGFVMQYPELIDELLEGLDSSDDVVRGRTADALERVARSRPEPFVAHLPCLMALARSDPVPMVRWHMAMLLADLVPVEQSVEAIEDTLSLMLDDRSAFVRSWAVSGLCIVGRRRPDKRAAIIRKLRPLQSDRSTAVRNRVGKALDRLLDADLPLPKGWVKSSTLVESQ